MGCAFTVLFLLYFRMVYALEMDVRHRRAKDVHAIDDDASVELTESGSQGLVAKVKSGNRVIMASRREGIKSEDHYTGRRGTELHRGQCGHGRLWCSQWI